MIACYDSPVNDSTMLSLRCHLVFHLVCTPWQTCHTSSATLDVLSRGWLAKSEEILFLIDAQIQQAFIAKKTISCTF